MEKSSKCMNCINPGYCEEKSSAAESRVQKPPGTTHSAPGSKKGHGVATKLLNGVKATFFSSLELCNCSYIGTKDDSDNLEFRSLIREDGVVMKEVDGLTKS